MNEKLPASCLASSRLIQSFALDNSSAGEDFVAPRSQSDTDPGPRLSSASKRVNRAVHVQRSLSVLNRDPVCSVIASPFWKLRSVKLDHLPRQIPRHVPGHTLDPEQLPGQKPG